MSMMKENRRKGEGGFYLESYEAYDLTVSGGFVDSEVDYGEPLDDCFHLWQRLGQGLCVKLSSSPEGLRDAVHQLPLLDVSGILNNRTELKKAHSLLGYLSHAYIHGGDTKAEKLPASLATPWELTATALGLPLVATHASLDLWNWTLASAEGGMCFENLRLVHSFTGHRSEECFHLIPMLVDFRGAKMIELLFELDTIRETDDQGSIDFLLCALFPEIGNFLDHTMTLIKQLRTQCDPQEFYYNHRPFLQGTDNVVFQGLTVEQNRLSKGASAAQSSTMQLVDILLGVEHNTTNFLREMRMYMPLPHRRFLEDVTPLGDYITRQSCIGSHAELRQARNTCLDALARIRSLHMGLAHSFIVQVAKTPPPLFTHPPTTSAFDEVQNQSASSQYKGDGKTGTGGTDFMTFLRSCRKDTDNAKAKTNRSDTLSQDRKILLL